MSIGQIFTLALLAAIWGGSFIFMKILSPALGVLPTSCLRVLIAGGVLTLVFKLQGVDFKWKQHAKHYVFVGLVGAALPFSLFAYAALYLPSSYMVVLNATTPFSGVILAALFLSESLTVLKVFGSLLGIYGVYLLTDFRVLDFNAEFTYSFIACLVAASSYSVSAVYTKTYLKDAPAKGIAGATQLLAGIGLAPLALFGDHGSGDYTLNTIVVLVAFSLLSSALAFLLYFQLLSKVGPSKSLIVTFLMPVFGIFWGVTIFSETLSAKMAIGTLVILLSSYFVTTKRTFASKTKLRPPAA